MHQGTYREKPSSPAAYNILPPLRGHFLPLDMPQEDQSLGAALKKFLDKSTLKPRLNELRIRENWEKLMGKTIARYTGSLELREHTLIITTTVSPLRHELSLSKEKIIRLVNEELGEDTVREIIIR